MGTASYQAIQSLSCLSIYSVRTWTTHAGARGSIVVEALCCKSEGRRFENRWSEGIFWNYPIFPAALGRGVNSISNRNEYQRQKQKCFSGVERSRCVRPTSPTSVRWLSTSCRILNISQPYRLPWHVTSQKIYVWTSTACYGDGFTFYT
jgi:hypothetical protein